MMKKLLSCLSLSLLLVGCSSNNATHQETNTPTVAPSTTEEPTTETLQITNPIDINTKTLDMDGYPGLNTTTSAYQQISIEESLRFYEEGGTGILFYSYDTCPWCRRAVTVLNDAARELGVTVYYVDVYEDEVLNGKGGFSEEGNALIKRLLADLDPILDHEVNEETGEEEPAFYTPTVVAVKDGEFVGYHVSLVDSFTIENENSQMNSEQKAELKAIYQDLMRKIAD